jgi:glycerate kinase
MKVVIAPDSFKDSLDAAGVARAIASGLAQVWPQATLVECPMADGGEGTMEAIVAASQGEQRRQQVRGPLGASVEAAWGWLPESRTAVIEMAQASGIQLVPSASAMPAAAAPGAPASWSRRLGGRRPAHCPGHRRQRHQRRRQRHAARPWPAPAGCTRPALAEGGLALAQLARIDASGLDPRLAQVQVEVAADVDNPLCGANGASAIFGPQKGASPEQVQALDQALGHFADHCAQLLGKDVRDQPGSGAAGGMGFAAKAFMGAQFRPGVEVVAELAQLDALVQGADLVITGEGVSMRRPCAARPPWVSRGSPNAMACPLWCWLAPWARAMSSCMRTASTPRLPWPAGR